MALQIQQAAARVQQCLEDPLISTPFPEEICSKEFTTCVDREQAIARIKCEQELVRLDTELARLDRANEARIDDIELESFDTCETLAPLRFLFEKRIINDAALITAAEKGQTSVVKMLLADAHVNPSANDNDAICIASAKGHTDVVEVLLADARVDPTANTNQAIRVASSRGHTNVVKVLLADPRVAANDNFAICIASDNGHTDVVKVLLADLRVDPSADNNYAIRIASSAAESIIRVKRSPEQLFYSTVHFNMVLRCV